MEMEKWSNLLLNWIDHTGLLPTIEISASEQEVKIEDTDIQSFYDGYLELLKLSSPTGITEFLKVNYPEFELTSSGDDLPPPSDFYLIYSILLHYGCITRLDKQVQRTSQSLSAAEQLAVTVFLDHFLTRNSVTRPALIDAIRDAVQSMDAGPLAKFYAEDENGNRGGADAFSTPKTSRLEQNCREMNRLRGQVDTVDCELGYLEALVREKDAKIVYLKQRETDLTKEIHDLKKSYSYGGGFSTDSEGHRTSAAEDLARKERAELRALRKNNVMLEDKVESLLIEVSNLSNDKMRLVAKLKASVKDLKAYRERENELANLIEELNSDLEAKTRRISDLVETNMELESYISENKSLWHKNFDTMNTSSISMCSSSGNGGDSDQKSSTTNLPANLGSCIIDIQLKEMEMENAELRAKLESLHNKSMGMQAGIEQFLEENQAIRDKCGCNHVVPGMIPEFFKALTEALKDKSQLESTVQGQVTMMLRFKDERDRLKEELTAQSEKCLTMEQELNGLRETVKNYAETENKTLDTFKYKVKHLNDLMTVQKLEKESFKSAIEKGEEDVYAKIRRIAKLNAVIERLRFEKKKADNEHQENEANLNRLWEIKMEEARTRHMELERRLLEVENVSAMRQKHIELMEQQRDELSKRNEELRSGKELAEKKATEREEVLTRELDRLKGLVDSMEQERNELKKININLETKTGGGPRLKSKSSVEDEKTEKFASESDPERDIKARRSSLLHQWTSTPRLSMKQKVRIDQELWNRRRISLLSPDEATSSESDNNAFVTPASGDGCVCKGSGRPSKAQKAARRDSLIYNSPVRKKSSSSKGLYDRTAVNKWQKQKRQRVFNKARLGMMRDSEVGVPTGGRSTPLDSLAWDNQFDLLDLEGGAGEDFGANDEEIQQNFHEILKKERRDGEDLFEPHGEVEEEGNKEGHRTTRTEISIERHAEDGKISPPLLRSSFERSAASTVPSKSYSMHWGSEQIPTASVVHFSPRSERVSVCQTGIEGMLRWDLNLIPMSQQNLLQLIAVVLIGIFVAIVYSLSN